VEVAAVEEEVVAAEEEVVVAEVVAAEVSTTMYPRV
jgi:hypothetical protein